MSHSLIIKEHAVDDIHEAAEWYNKQKTFLADEFVEEINSALEVITVNPFIYQQRYRNTRHAVVNRFPYVIVYRIEGQEIIVYSVIHTRQHPKKRTKRVKKK